MRQGGSLSRPIRILRAFVLILLLIAIVSLSWSFVGAMTAPGSSPAGVRVVEWISNDLPGGRQVVLAVERLWYTWHAPPVGGLPAGGLPSSGTGLTGVTSTSGTVSPSIARSVPHLGAPLPIDPIVSTPLAGEGQWQVVGRTVKGLPTIRVAFLRPDTVHTSLVTGVMWMDTKLLRAVLVPGTKVPGRNVSWQGLHFSVPASARTNLAAIFNSGFLLRDSGGGWYGQGHTVVPLIDGAASLVILKDGSATVARWGRDATMGPSIEAVRQNLHLLVDRGQVTPEALNSGSRAWGATLGNAVLVWRSGIGVTKEGALVYAAGKGLSVQSLAAVLQHAGAVRAMELDINSQWTSAYYYSLTPGSADVVSPSKLLPNMVRASTRFLVPDQRDFIAMFLRPAPANS